MVNEEEFQESDKTELERDLEEEVTKLTVRKGRSSLSCLSLSVCTCSGQACRRVGCTVCSRHSRAVVAHPTPLIRSPLFARLATADRPR